MPARGLRHGVVMAVTRLEHLVNEQWSTWNSARDDRLCGLADRVADPSDLYAPSPRREGEKAVDCAKVSIARNADRGDVGNYHPADPPPVGEMEMPERARRRVDELKVPAKGCLVEQRIKRILQVPRIGVADVEVLSAAGRVANRERQLPKLWRKLAKLCPGPLHEVSFPMILLSIAAAQV